MEILLKILDPTDTSTGGGSASALAGAMAGALVAMVARLSATAQNEAGQPFCTRIFTQAEELSRRLVQGGQADSEAFQSVRRAYKLPSQTEEENAVRRLAIQAAWLEAARVPLDNAERCLQVCALGVELFTCANPNALSDLTCAGLLARAGGLGCLENVKINLPSIKDPATVAALADHAARLSEQFAALEPRAKAGAPTP